MDQQTLAQYLHLMDTAKEDPDYLQLCAEYEKLDAHIQDLVARLPDDDRELLMDYIGLIGAVNGKLVEIACKI